MGADCSIPGSSTLKHLSLSPGYWRIADESLVLHPCVLKGSCSGGLGLADVNSAASYSINQYCAPGFTGILCAVCVGNYYFSPEAHSCLPCEAASGLSSPTMIVFLTILAVFIVGLIVSIIALRNCSVSEDVRNTIEMSDQMSSSVGFLAHNYPAFLRNGKALASSFQIAVAIDFNCQILFPPIFKDILLAFNFVNLDIVPSLGLSCKFTGYNFTFKLLIATLAPIAVGAMLLCIYQIERLRRCGKARNMMLIGHVQGLPSTEFNKLRTVLQEEFGSRIGDTSSASTFNAQQLHDLLSEITPYASRQSIECQVRILLEDKSEVDASGIITALDTQRRQNIPPPKDKSITILTLILSLTYFVLISTSTTIFRYLKCEPFPVPNAPTQYYLYADYSIDCSSSTYAAGRAYAIFMICLYPVGSKYLSHIRSAPER